MPEMAKLCTDSLIPAHTTFFLQYKGLISNMHALNMQLKAKQGCKPQEITGHRRDEGHASQENQQKASLSIPHEYLIQILK